MVEEIIQSAATGAKPAKTKSKKSKRKQGAKTANGATKRGIPLGYPKHPVKSLRMPQAVLENNAGKGMY